MIDQFHGMINNYGVRLYCTSYYPMYAVAASLQKASSALGQRWVDDDSDAGPVSVHGFNLLVCVRVMAR